jgi:putative ABC transport system permease protein
LAGALGPTAGFGVQLAFSGSRRGRAGRAGVVAVAIAVAGVLAVTAVEQSAGRLTSTPRLYGAGWDAVLGLDVNEKPDDLVRRLEAEPDVSGVGSLDVPGDDVVAASGPGGTGQVEPEALTSWAGAVTPTLTDGRLPVGPGEVAIGATVADQLGADVGDTVEVHGYGDVRVPFVVVGRVINAGSDELGDGFQLTQDGLRAMVAGCPRDSDDLKCMIITTGVGVSLRPGVDVAAAIARLREIDDRFVATPPPSIVNNLRQIGSTPWFLAVFLIVLGVSGLAHALVTGRRLGRRDVAITRALGFSPTQAAATVCWQAVVVGAVGATAGVLIGLLAGRMVWRRVAEGTGALVETVVPPWVWVVAPATALVVALALAVGPAFRMAGERPGEILRTE